MLSTDADQLLYPADVLASCACGWWRSESSCYVPVAVVMRAEIAWGTSTGATKELWTRLRGDVCDAGAVCCARSAGDDAGRRSGRLQLQ
jgi:hypothetical protein